MEVVFDISDIPEQLYDIVEEFSDALVSQLRRQIVESIPKERLQTYCQTLVYAPFINWVSQPMEFSVPQMYKIIQVGISYKKQDGKVFFGPAIHFFLPGTTTPFTTVLKFLSYGDGNLRGIHQIQNIFSLYNEKINEYWDEFLTQYFEDEEDYE